MPPTVPPTRPIRLGSAAVALTFFTALVVACSENAISPGDGPLATRDIVVGTGFTKAFLPGTIGPGSATTLKFTIANTAPGGPIGDLAFTDNLPAGVTIAAPANASTTCGPGTVTAPEGGTTISLSGGSVGANSTCTVSVDVTSSTVNTHTNTSGQLTSNDAGSPHGTATADLIVSADRPGFTKAFSPSAVPFGGRSTLTFTVDNTANTSPVTALQFIDNLPAGMVVASPPNAATTCQNASVGPATLTANPGSSIISLSAFNGTTLFPIIAAGGTCTVTVDVIGGAVGALGNTSSDLLVRVGGSSTDVSAGKAAAVLTVTVNALSLTKAFTNDPASPGGTVTLQFTVRNLSRSEEAENIAFDDDLNAALSGLVAAGTFPMSNVCNGTGTLHQSSPATLEFSDGRLDPEASCTFSVSLDVPAGAPAGSHTNTTSQIMGDVGVSAVVGDAASDVLFVSVGPILSKTFTNDPVAAGDIVTLEFTIANPAASAMTDIAFEDVFDVILPTASSVPTGTFCGPSSTATFTPRSNPSGPGGNPANLLISGASLAAAGQPGDSCTFSIDLDVAPDAPSGAYTNTTSLVAGTVAGSPVQGPAASDVLSVVAAPDLQKSFSGSVLPGGTVTLEFTLAHSPNAAGDAIAMSFTDDLDATLAGLVATGTFPMLNVCNGTGVLNQVSDVSSPARLEFSGGTLSPGDECSFSVDLAVPSTASTGSYTNTTSNLSAVVSTLAVTNDPATAVLTLIELVLSKQFIDDPVLPGDQVTLQFTLTNQGSTDIPDYAFSDELSEMQVTGLLVNSVDPGTCSSATVTGVGTGVITVDKVGGTPLAGGASCSINVTIDVPSGAATGDHPNRTSVVRDHATPPNVIANPAYDDLLIVSPLTLTKVFINDPVEPGDLATLRFTISNVDDEPATGLAFTDDLNATLPGLVATGLPAAACGGTLNGTDVIALSGGTLGAGSSCTFDVTLQVPAGAADGNYINTTSSITGTIDGGLVTGDPASDVLMVAERFSPLIDIKPGSDPNTINCNNRNQLIPVAILTSAGFDALVVDHTTVKFHGATESHEQQGQPARHESDVDGDGDIDLVFHFKLADTDLYPDCNATEGLLTGQTFDGVEIQGTDAIRFIGN